MMLKKELRQAGQYFGNCKNSGSQIPIRVIIPYKGFLIRLFINVTIWLRNKPYKVPYKGYNLNSFATTCYRRILGITYLDTFLIEE